MKRGENLRKYTPYSPKKAVISIRLDEEDKEAIYHISPKIAATIRQYIKKIIKENTLQGRVDK